MAILIPPGQGKSPRKKIIKARPVRPAKAAETQYRKELQLLIRRANSIALQVQSGLGPESTATDALRQLQAIEAIIDDTQAATIAGRVVGVADKAQKARFEKVMARALGVDVASILDAEGVAAAFDTAIAENVSLIKSVPKNQFDDISRLVIENFKGIQSGDGTLREKIQKKLRADIQLSEKKALNRAKLIARDQSEKLNASFNEARQTENGINEYIWRTAGDERVVGDPGGLYPEGNSMHMNHFKRDGETFRWDSPPPDGHPGQAINCRCVAEALIDRETLDVL